jgi:hypothetical protein
MPVPKKGKNDAIAHVRHRLERVRAGSPEPSPQR